MKESGRVAVTRQSSCRSEPAAALRGFANGSSPWRRMSWFIAAKCSFWRRTSPRTSSRAGGRPASRAGTPPFAPRPPTVLRLAVTSSPFTPSPRVEPLDEHAVLVDELDREPVELRLGDVGRPRVLREAEEAADARVELVELRVGLDVPEREHRLAVDDAREPVRGRAGDPARGRVRGGELRVRRLERGELAHEPVVLGVGEERPVEDVVGVVRRADRGAQLRDAGRGVRGLAVGRHAPTMAPGAPVSTSYARGAGRRGQNDLTRGSRRSAGRASSNQIRRPLTSGRSRVPVLRYE